jgi:uncharacterized membrane protein
MTQTSANKLEWLVPTGLILLALVPVASGLARVLELGTSTTITPENQRFFAAPFPIVAHSLGGIVFLVLGAFQFSSRLRRQKPSWHKMAGRILIPSGLVVALSGMWMAHFYHLPEFNGELVHTVRLVFGSSMLVSIGLATVAIYRRDFTGHGVWMTRGYAIGAAAGTQLFTAAPLLLLSREYLNDLTWAISLSAGWVINLAVAEWAIRRRLQAKYKGATA